MATYNGHKNWNHWKVSLWINNDECLYELAQLCLKDAKQSDTRKQGESITELAAKMFFVRAEEGRTLDSAPYSISSIKAAIAGIGK